jgi:hypothetical protein
MPERERIGDGIEGVLPEEFSVSLGLAIVKTPVAKEARIIAARLGSPLPAYANWTLRLLPRKIVELGIVDPVSYETVRLTLKKTG